MLTASADERDLFALPFGGTRGYLLKAMDSEMLAGAIPPHDGGQSGREPGDDRQAGQCALSRAGRLLAVAEDSSH